MGCDIHMFAETKSDSYWNYTGAFWENEYYNPDQRPSDWNEKLTDAPYSGRNYNLFALLADVRNGYGFAGCDTGDAIKPISSPRGIPDDIDDYIKKQSDVWECDGHSHSHLTLSELLEAQGPLAKITRGWVNSKQYISFKDTGTPDGWCGGVGGGDTEHISNKDMDQRINDGKLTGHEYTQIEFARDLGGILDDLIDNLKMLLRFVNDDANKIRIVFWFDN